MKPRVSETTEAEAFEAEERRKKVAAAARLPDAAEAKLRSLVQTADEAQALVANCKDRLGKLQADANNGHAVAAKEMSELQAAMARHDARYRNSLAVFRSCRDFLGRCERDGIRLEPFVRKAGRVRLRPPDTSPQKMIEQHRLTIDTLRTTIAGIERLPVPFEDQRAVVEKFVDDLLDLGRPMLIAPNGEIRLAFPAANGTPESNFNGFSNRRLFALGLFLSGADRDTVVSKLCELLPPSSSVNAMSAKDKKAKIEDLREQILAACRSEEELIQRLADDGVVVLRRTDTDPLAVLGLQVAPRGARAAA
jgi:hypothetical protein